MLTNQREPVAPNVIVLCWNTPDDAERRALKIAEFLGARARCVSLTAAALSDEATMREVIPKCDCLIAETETVAKAAAVMPTGISGVVTLTGLASTVLLYGFQSKDSHNDILYRLSSGGLRGVQTPGAGERFRVAKNRREWCAQLSGISLGTVDPSVDRNFLEAGNSPQQDCLIQAGEKPFFVRANIGDSQIFFLACDDFADLDEKVRCGVRRIHWFSRLVPLVMLLRGTLKDRVWHSNHPRACFIIDDPLLTARYGFLDYRRLLEVIQRGRFSASIAFIPWNYRRSSKKVATLISTSYGLPFVCVHGCDHTSAEFASADAVALHGKARLALERMRAHHRLSGLPFDDVMVFPQGRFSVEAVKALKASDYLAAVNGDVVPAATSEADALVLRDLLEVAVTRFSDFPLFGRRYPRDLGEFALDLFFGKPALVAEHHSYFRNGYKDLEAFGQGLNSLDDRLEWTNLAAVCSRSYMTRTTENGDVHIRFYTSRFWLKNTGAQTQRYVLLKREAQEGPAPAVDCDGRTLHCEREGADVKIILSLAAGESANLQIGSAACASSVESWTPTASYKVKVFARRMLGEVRDNYVEYAGFLRRVFFVDRKWARDAKSEAP